MGRTQTRTRRTLGRPETSNPNRANRFLRGVTSAMAFKLVDRRTLPRALAALCCVLALAATLSAQTYQKPPQAVLDVLNAPVPPTGALSPTRDYMLLAQGVRYPPLKELAQPMLRLAGLRINPNTTGPHRAN